VRTRHWLRVSCTGCNRLPSYMKRVRQGVLDPKANIEVRQITPVVTQIDGKNGEPRPSPLYIPHADSTEPRNSGFGFISASMGMSSCIEMAKTYGIGMCSIKHSNHFGMSASFVLQAAKEGFMSLVFTNSSPAVSPRSTLISKHDIFHLTHFEI
jgi:LDH2 family malate/lactate/ureidoglycolate dehydrogenase